MRNIIFFLVVLSACATHHPPTIMSGHKVMERKYYEVLGAQESLRNTGAGTIAIWFRQRWVSPVFNQDLFNIAVGGAKEIDYKSRAGIRIIPSGAFQSVARAADMEEPSEVTTAPGLAKKNVWQHLALTIDYTNKKQEFFLDGKRIESTGKTIFTKPTTADSPSQRVTIGSEDDGSASFFFGDLGTAFVEKRILTEAEIQKLMIETKP